jgi:BirA family biotin operon repressor/biotin-[acetyl-CoA-carboxylase] ligase
MKERLLLTLKENKGTWVSGEILRSGLSVSRSAVWKHMRKLKEEGYDLESSPNKGYLLRGVPDLLLPQEVRYGLVTKVFGNKGIIYASEVDSTNTLAKERALKGAAEGTLVIAEKQTRGRGRIGREWFSPPRESIYISTILRPSISPGEAPRITLLAAVAVAEALLAQTGLRVHIKWPNDVLVGDKKIAGILTEMSSEMDAVNFIILGVGINVNVPAFPEGLKEKATSVLLETGGRHSRKALAQQYLKRLEEYYEHFRKARFPIILKRWKELAHMLGRQVIVEFGGSRVAGQAQGIDSNGVLILRDRKGKTHRIFSGEVSYLGKSRRT